MYPISIQSQHDLDVVRCALYARLEKINESIIWYQKMSICYPRDGFYARNIPDLENQRYRIHVILESRCFGPFIHRYPGSFLPENR